MTEYLFGALIGYAGAIVLACLAYLIAWLGTRDQEQEIELEDNRTTR